MYNVLILCTGNSCRSILGEALINHMAKGRFQAFSAGSKPTGQVNPYAIKTLQLHHLPTQGLHSQSWNEFSGKNIDLVISVCDNAAGETCPANLQPALRAHWGLPDPAHAQGTETEIVAAFEYTFSALEKRIQLLLKLPFEQLSDQQKVQQLNAIGLIKD